MFNMKKFPMSGAVCATALFLVTAASAQDGSPATNRWDGFFVGVNAGGAVGSSSTSLEMDFGSGNYVYPNIDFISAAGFTGGVGAGYNFSSGPYIFGLDADIAYLGAKGSDETGYVVNPPYNDELLTQYHTLGTIRAKMGISNDKLLGYATGGLAFGSYEDAYGTYDTSTNYHEVFRGGTQTSVGYVIGAGLEYAVTEKVSVKAEYLFADLGKSTLDINKVTNQIWASGGGYGHINHQLNIIRVGLNVKF